MRTEPTTPPARPSPARCLAGFLIPAVCLSGALAQSDPPPPGQPPEADAVLAADQGAEQIEHARPPAFTLTLGASASYRFDSEFDSGSSDVSIARVGASAEGAFLVGDRSMLTLTLATEHSFYDFAPMGVLVPGGVDPFGSIHDYSARARFSSQINRTWSVIVGGGVNSSGESSANFSDTLTYNVLGGATYRVNDALSIGGALVITTRLEDEITAFPIPIITWNIDDRWRLESKGFGMLLSYKASDTVRVGLEGMYERREYRLDDTGPLAAGVVREVRLPAGLWVEWKPAAHITLEGTLGADIYVEFESYTSAGVRFADDLTDPAIYAGLTLSYRF